MTLKEQFANGEITAEQYAEALQAENDKLKANAGGVVRMKISDKGGMSLYGLGRFPVTLYKSQWFKLLSNSPAIVEFLKAHDSELSEKSTATEAKAA